MSSVREKTPQQVSSVPFLIEGAFYFSQKNTDEQNTQSFTETLSQPISQNVTANRSLTPSPSPNGEGSDHRDTPMGWMWANCCPLFVPTLAVTLCELCMPKAFCGLEMWAKNLCELCALCERKNYPHTHLQCSFSHRRTQKNRTHSIPQRH